MAVLGEEDEEGKAAIWEILRRLEAQRLQCLLGEAYKASLVWHCGSTVSLGAEAEEAVHLAHLARTARNVRI